jgi:hypothetical protein
MRIVTALGIVALLLFTLAGCGGKGAIAKVSGKVTVGGQPVTGAMINFVSPETGVAASDNLDAGGAYDIQAGLKPGTYKVFVVPASSADQPPMPGKPPPKASESKVPLKYRSDATSGLTAELKEGDNPNKDFALD